MDKKLNKNIEEILIDDNILEKLNKTLEKKVLNSNVIIFIDFLTMQKYEGQIENLKKVSLNNLIIKVIKSEQDFLNSDINLDETYGFVVGIGESSLLLQTQNYAIENNINYGFVNLFLLKLCIFGVKTGEKEFFPPNFILIEKNILLSKDKFLMLSDMFSYCYLNSESVLDFENKRLKEFSGQFKNILAEMFSCYNKENNFLSCENLYSNFISTGIIIQKYKVKTNLFASNNSFKNFIANFVILLCYKNIFSFINKNNLILTRPTSLSDEEILNYDKIDFDFYKIFLLNFKQKFLDIEDASLKFYINLLNFLKNNFFEEFYNQTKNCHELDLSSINFDNTFLKKMSFFEIFNKMENLISLKL